MTHPDDRLKALGLSLPTPPKPAASYVGYRVVGDLVFVSGQLPMREGAIVAAGRLGDAVTLEQGQEAARVCALNVLAQVRDACGGDLGRVTACVRLGGFVASTPDFADHHKVINGASDLVAAVLGDEAGAHARAAVGVAALPLSAAVEVDGIFRIG